MDIDKDFLLKLAFRIKYERAKKAISQEELAEMSEVSINTIGRLERGLINISITNFCRIAKVLDMDLGILSKYDIL